MSNDVFVDKPPKRKSSLDYLRETKGSFDVWQCKKCDNKFERNVKLKSIPKCPKCKTVKLIYRGQVSI